MVRILPLYYGKSTKALAKQKGINFLGDADSACFFNLNQLPGAKQHYHLFRIQKNVWSYLVRAL